jgi:hypothetical protein
MTAYANFVQDMPSRCLFILDDYEARAAQTGLEVTLTLAIASLAFVVPFERLCPSSKDHVAPDRYDRCVKEMGRLLGRSFSSWVAGHTWKHLPPIAGEKVRGVQVEQWLDLSALRPITGNVGWALARLRNSLAHGNIFSYPSAAPLSRRVPDVPITRLVFLAKCREKTTRQLLDGYDTIVVSPSDFLSFLRSWTKFLLDDLRLPEEPIQGTFHELPAFSDTL